MNKLHIDVLRLILSRAITSSSLQTCHQWRAIILGLGPHILQQEARKSADRAVSAHDVRQIPASMYNMLTFEQQVMIPNILLRGDNRLILRDYKYRVPWCDIVLSKLPRKAYYDDTGIIYDGLEGHAEHFCYVFENYEQHRHFVITSCMGTTQHTVFSKYVENNSYLDNSPSMLAQMIWVSR